MYMVRYWTVTRICTAAVDIVSAAEPERRAAKRRHQDTEAGDLFHNL